MVIFHGYVSLPEGTIHLKICPLRIPVFFRLTSQSASEIAESNTNLELQVHPALTGHQILYTVRWTLASTGIGSGREGFLQDKTGVVPAQWRAFWRLYMICIDCPLLVLVGCSSLCQSLERLESLEHWTYPIFHTLCNNNLKWLILVMPLLRWASYRHENGQKITTHRIVPVSPSFGC